MDPIRTYLKERGCANHVVEGGLEYLVRQWESTARSVASHGQQEYYSYLNDMDGREILHGALPFASAGEKAEYTSRVERADALIRRHLRPVMKCLWGEEVEAKRGLSPSVNWWYFAVPPVPDNHEVWQEVMRDV
jgi:hypothetical protein